MRAPRSQAEHPPKVPWEKKNKEEEKEQRTVSGRTPATTARRRRNDGTSSSSSSYLLGKREYKSPKATTMLQRTVGAGQRFKAVKSSFKFCSQNFSEMHMNLHNVKEMLSCKRSNAPVAGVSVLVTKHLKTSESGGRGGSGEKHKTCQFGASACGTQYVHPVCGSKLLLLYLATWTIRAE